MCPLSTRYEIADRALTSPLRLYLLHVKFILAVQEPTTPVKEEDQDEPPKYSEARESDGTSNASSGADSMPSQSQDSTPESSPSIGGIASDSDKIPVDRDGWQIGGEALLHDETPTFHGQSHEWIPVKSRKTKRAEKEKGIQQNTEPFQPLDSTESVSSHLMPDSAAEPQPKVDKDQAETRPKAPKKKKRKGSAAHTVDSVTNELDKKLSFAARLSPSLLDGLQPHRDEEQVDKDIRRSFVGPAFAGMDSKAKAARRVQLEELVISTLRRYPELSYFQGYHDIVAILLLSLTCSSSFRSDWADDEERDQVSLAVGRMSLHYIRDSMTNDLNPIMGQLKLLRNVVRAHDACLARRIERASSVPFFALSWLLTLFAHDLEDMAQVRCCFDFLLAHGPASAVYLCAAVVLAKRAELDAMQPEDAEDPSMLHMVLSQLPPLCPGSGSGSSTTYAPLYADPDVEPPSERAGVARTEGEGGVTLPRLLAHAADLMRRHPLRSTAVGGTRIMGPRSTLFTWSELPPAGSWEQVDLLAQRIVTDVDGIVLDPHPDPDHGDADEKGRRKRPTRYTLVSRDSMLVGTAVTVIGVAGVAMALYASDNPASEARGALGAIASILKLVSGPGQGPGPGPGPGGV